MRNTLKVPLFALLLAATGVLAAPSKPPAQHFEPQPLRASAVFTGPHSQVKDRSVIFLTDQPALDQAWKRHTEGAPEQVQLLWLSAPRIDFDRFDAVMIFGGQSQNARGYRIMEVIDLPEARAVRFERESFQTFGGAAQVSPWALVLIPRSDRPLVAEENTQNLKDHPPEWTARGRLDR